jgi:phosphatidylglycerol:prolipoprotein diacylglycerol transferase
VGDAVLPALILGQVLGRIGCFLVGDDHGHPWDGPWAVVFPAREGSLVQPEYITGAVPLHPSQLYLSLMNLVIFVLAARMFARRRFDGQVSAFVIVAYAVGRFCVEYTRGDDVARGWIDFGPVQLFTSQWISVVMVFIGAAVWMVMRNRPSARIEPST